MTGSFNESQRDRGFTLIELLVVIAIIAALAAITTSAINMAQSKARDVKCRANLGQLYTAATNYRYDSHYNHACAGNW